MKILNFKLATQLSLVLFALFALFHFAVITGITVFDYVPIDFLWGGRMETKEQLLGFEIVSLLVMILCLLIVLIRAERIRIPSLMSAARITLWILSILFFLNTIGNIMARTTFEKGFAFITAVLALLCLRMAMEPLPTKK